MESHLRVMLASGGVHARLHGLTGHLLRLVHAGLHLGCRSVNGEGGPVGVILEREALLRVELDSPLSVHSEANAAGKSGHVSLASRD